MGTHAVTHITGENGRHIVSFLRTVGGHPTEHGNQLRDILSRIATDFLIEGQVAALIIADLSLIANIEICDQSTTGDFDYYVRVRFDGEFIKTQDANSLRWHLTRSDSYNGQVVADSIKQ